MKILHCADLHLGSPLTAHSDGGSSAVRQRELTVSFFRLIRTAKEAGATVFFLCGDVFDSETVTEVHVSDFLSEIEKNPEIRFYYVSGNHEKDLLKNRTLPENLYTFGDGWQYYRLPGITIAGMNSPTEGMFSSLNLPDKTLNFVLLHGAVSKGTAGEIPLAAAAGKSIDYLALGHYHTYSALPIDPRGVAVYPGSPEGRGFDELGEHGCVLIDTEGARPAFRFVRTASRLFLAPEVSVDGATDAEEIERRADAVLSGTDKSSAIRLTFVGTNTGVPLPISSLTYRYAPEFFLFTVKDHTAPDLHAAALSSPLARAFISCCEESADLTEKEKSAILKIGLSALSGEKIDADI